MITEEHLIILQRVAAHWDGAEFVIKSAETIRGEVVLPSINELRYAGRRLVDAILVAGGKSLDQARSTDEQINSFAIEAEQFCVRAQHDAVDASVLYLKNHTKLLADKFGMDEVVSHCPEYIPMCIALDEIADLIADSRRERHLRMETYVDIVKNQFPVILNKYKTLLYGENILILARKKSAYESKSKRFLFWVSISGLTIGVITLVDKIYTYFVK